MTNYHFLLFTTCNSNPERISKLHKLIESVDHACAENGLRIMHYVLIQNVDQLPKTLKSADHRQFFIADELLSLSKARNIMLAKAFESGDIDNSEVCAFPDDDAWYPSGTLKLINDFFLNQRSVDVFTCKYGVDASSQSSNLTYKLKTDIGSYIKTASSNTIFLRSKLAVKIKYFDERLGVGAEINGGEDLDYAIRAYLGTEAKKVNSPLMLVGHRDKVSSIKSTYFQGSLYALAKSSKRSLALRIQCVRKVMIGLFLVLRGELAFKAFKRSLLLAFL